MPDVREGARLICLDIKHHFLATPMFAPEYVIVQIKYTTTEIRIKCNIDNIVTLCCWAHMKIQKRNDRLDTSGHP